MTGFLIGIFVGAIVCLYFSSHVFFKSLKTQIDYKGFFRVDSEYVIRGKLDLRPLPSKDLIKKIRFK